MEKRKRLVDFNISILLIYLLRYSMEAVLIFKLCRSVLVRGIDWNGWKSSLVQSRTALYSVGHLKVLSLSVSYTTLSKIKYWLFELGR